MQGFTKIAIFFVHEGKEKIDAIYFKAKYQVGDILHVRETWCQLYDLDGNDQIIEGTQRYYYRADGKLPPYTFILKSDGTHTEDWIWRPSIHMPKEASRIFLEVTDVRVEKLQDITEEGSTIEGIEERILNPKAYEINGDKKIYNYPDGSGTTYSAIDAFQTLWNSTIKKQDIDKYGWKANPWVWVYEFKRVEIEK